MHAVIAVKQTNVVLMRKSKLEDIIEKHNYFVSGTYLIGHEPADLTVHPPQNCRGWVHFFRIGV